MWLSRGALARGVGQFCPTLAQAARSAKAGSVTSKTSTGDVDGPKIAGSAGVNTAVSWCPPAANVDVDADAVPLLTITGLPRLVAPSLNCTLPGAVAGVIVALIVTSVPRLTGEPGYVVSAVLVAAAPGKAPGAPVITKATGGDVDGLKAAGALGVNTAVS